MPSRSVPIPGQLSRTRWVGTVLTGTLVVLISAAMLGTWSQAALLRSTNEAAAEIRLHQEASGLVTHEHYLMQAMVTNPSAAEQAELLAIQPRVIASFERLAEISTDGRSATFEVLAG